ICQPARSTISRSGESCSSAGLELLICRNIFRPMSSPARLWIAPRVARHRNMSHALPCLVAKTGRDQFVIAPHRAIEEDQRRAGKPRLQIVIDGRAGGEKVEVLAGSLVANPKPNRIARAIVGGGVSLAFQIPRAFAG